MIDRLRAAPRVLLGYCRDVNIFPSIALTTDPDKLRTQRISTRVFIITFLISAAILLIYTATAQSIHIFTIPTPELQQYDEFYQQHPQTLTCPCSQISNNYSSFIEIAHHLHPVCSSMYINDRWLTYLGILSTDRYTDDFRVFGTSLFQAIRSLCQLAEESIRISLAQFYSSMHVTDVVTSEDRLHSQSDAIIKQFIASTTNNFLLSFRMIGNTTHVNAIMSALQSNVEFVVRNGSVVSSMWRTIGNCSCAYSSACTASLAIYLDVPVPSGWVVPGFREGCFVLEALRQSDLRCFYNQTCLQDLHLYIASNQSLNLSTLDSSVLRRFDVSTQIGVIIDALMVHEWRWNISHASYYGMCQPKECTYTILGTDAAIGIIVTVVGSIGGLLTVEKIVVPLVVKCLARCVRKLRHRTVHPGGNTLTAATKTSEDVKLEDIEHS